MGLDLVRENFNYYDVSDVKIEERLTFGTEIRDMVARSEDEAFIKEAIWERGGNKYDKKIPPWAKETDWNDINAQMNWLATNNWIKTDYRGKEQLPEIVAPDPEKDQVEENYSSFYGTGLLFERYLEKVCYPNKMNEDGWDWKVKIIKPGSQNKVKLISEFVDIYEDLSRMHIIPVMPPTVHDGVKMTGVAKWQEKWSDGDDKEKVQDIEASATLENVTMDYTDGTLTAPQGLKAKYTGEDGSTKEMWFVNNYLLQVDNRHEVEFKDGKDDDGRQKYRTGSLLSEKTVDIEIDTDGWTWEVEDGVELEFDILGAVAFVEVYDQTYDYDEKKSHTWRSEFYVKVPVYGRTLKLDDEIRSKLIDKIPELQGKLTHRTIKLWVWFMAVDIKWNMSIEKSNN